MAKHSKSKHSKHSKKHKKKERKEKKSKRERRDTSSESESGTDDGDHGPPSPPAVAVGPERPASVGSASVSEIGPQRPPVAAAASETSEYGPQRPQPQSQPAPDVYGPQRPGRPPPASGDDEEETVGPQLPGEAKQKRTFGPKRPAEEDLADLEQMQKHPHLEQAESDDEIEGPSLAHMYQPQGESVLDKIREIEERSRAMKDQLTHKEENDQTVREEWMMELPKTGFSLGATLGARTFLKGGITQQDSGWTSTPGQERERAQQKEQQPRRPVAVSKRDEAIGAAVDAYNAESRGQSLLEQHKAAQPDGEKERFRAFDRDRDLLRGNVDRKRLAEVVDDSKKLDSKFARGERRFL